MNEKQHDNIHFDVVQSHASPCRNVCVYLEYFRLQLVAVCRMSYAVCVCANEFSCIHYHVGACFVQVMSMHFNYCCFRVSHIMSRLTLFTFLSRTPSLSLSVDSLAIRME